MNLKRDNKINGAIKNIERNVSTCTKLCIQDTLGAGRNYGS
jgi:hypothetical protein